MRTVKVTIQGITPLLQHRFAVEQADAVVKVRSGRPNYSQEVDRALYTDEAGTIYQPGEHLEAALRAAAKNFKVAGRRGASYSTLVGATVEVWPAAIPHEQPAWVVDARPVVVQRSRVLRYRPRFDEWKLSFELRCQDDQLPLPVLKQVLDWAGLYIGIGDFRPQKGGKFGKFQVVQWAEG